MSAVFKRIPTLAAGIFLLSTIILAATPNQPDQKIYQQYCVASPDSTCFDPVNGAVDSVGNDVAELGGDFRFCLEVDTVDSGYAPLRVILVLDNSGSMCTHYGPDNCCEAGDGSGFCSKNDPANKRVDAAVAFVNNLSTMSPESEVGVISFNSNATVRIAPTSLANQTNIDNILAAINAAKCTDTTDRFLQEDPDTLAKVAMGGGGGGGGGTNQGAALKRALVEADVRYATLPAFMTRHIIILTDGGWDDVATNSPATVINAYKTNTTTAERPLPKIHGVFLSDSVTHVTHLYPAQGCASSGLVELNNLRTASVDLSGGLFFGGATPQTVVQNFMALLDSVTQTAPQQLGSLKVTNTTTGASSTNGAIRQIGQGPTWETTLKALPLQFGPNVLTVERVIKRPGQTDSTVTTTVTIIRSDRFRQALDKDLFKLYCELQDASIKITATPTSVVANQPVTVTATISSATKFNISDVQVRLFSKFPDSDNGVLATFHLDEAGNGVVKNATNASSNGTGTPTIITTAEKLFGKGSMSGGSFSYSIPALNDAFVIEEWVRPVSGAAVLASGGGIEFGVDATGKLYLKEGANVVATSSIPVDMGVWSHVAVTRQNGQVVLFINGLAVSEPVAFATPVTAGALSFNCPNRWVVDEIRISNINRMTVEGTTRLLTIPTIPNPTWTIADAPSSTPTLKVAPASWKDGTTLTFTFSSPVDGTVLVNLKQNQSGNIVGTGWSKNSNPVEVADDRLGPFVRKGTLTPGPDKDTLLINFSEPVACDSIKAGPVNLSFEIVREGKTRTNALQDAKFSTTDCPQPFITEMSLIVPVGIDPGPDSMRLIGKTTDAAGNKPVKDSLGPIVWGKGMTLDITPIDPVGPNLTIDPAITSYLGIKATQGQLITLESKRLPLMPLDTIKDTIVYGYADVYDPVGNMVAVDLRVLESDRVDRKYYIYWNATNKNGRNVSTGAYLVHISYRYIDGQKGNEKRKFNLKRNFK